MKRLLVAVTVLVLLATMASSAFAALPGPGWWTSFQIQNVDTGDANLAYTAYWQVMTPSNDTTYSQDGAITLAEGAAVIYNPGLAPNYPDGPRIGFDTTDKHLPSGFAGGVTIQSDKAVRAVAQVGNNPAGSVGTTGGKASAFYQGTQGEDVGASISFPSMKLNYYGQTTSFYIQAAGEAATVNATFNASKCVDPLDQGTYPLTGISIPNGKTYLLDPSAAGVQEECLGSLVVDATAGSIAGVVIETQHSANPAIFALSTKGFAADDADTKVVAPTNKIGFYGGNTGWQLLNTNPSIGATVAVTFTVTNVQAGSAAASAGIAIGDQYRADVSIDANSSYLFSSGNGNYVAATPLGGAPTLTSGVFFAGVATSSQPLVGTVNENNGQKRLVYSAFPGKYATSSVAAPLVKEDFYGATTGLAVQNVGDVAAVVDLQYVCSGGADVYDITGQTIDVNSAKSFVDLNNVSRWGSVLVASGSQCAVSVTSTNGQPVVVLAQESNPAIDTKNYEGFNLTP